MIQHNKFHNGGFVLHKVSVGGKTYSVWYDSDGKPHDAEMKLRDGNTRSVSKRSVNLWAEFQRIGNRYRETPRNAFPA